MSVAAENPRAVIGDNRPPEPTAIERAEPHIETLRMFIAENPVLSTEEEASAAKKVHDTVKAALAAMERERKAKVDPLNAKLKTINGKYNRLHNDRGTGVWDNILGTLKSRMTSFAILQEQKRHEVEEKARREAEAAAEAARAAAEAEAQAREEANAGVCDVDLAAAIEASRETGQTAIRADWTARRAEKETKVRITGGTGNAVSLRDVETLHVTNCLAAIEALSDDDGNIPEEIAGAILKCARVYRKEHGRLPAGVTASYERSL